MVISERDDTQNMFVWDPQLVYESGLSMAPSLNMIYQITKHKYANGYIIMNIFYSKPHKRSYITSSLLILLCNK